MSTGTAIHNRTTDIRISMATSRRISIASRIDLYMHMSIAT